MRGFVLLPRRRAILGAAGLLVLAAVLVLAGGTPARAATKTVTAGPPDVKQSAPFTFDAYLPRTVAVRRGDIVRWRFAGFHTITFLRRGQKKPPFLVADRAHPYTGFADAAAQPFWFNGRPSLDFNPIAALPTRGPNSVTGNRYINSGLPQGTPPRPFAVRFNRTGTFKYVCDIHPDMEGFVRVVGRGARVPSAARDRLRARREEARYRASLRRLQTFTPPPATISGGHDRDPIEVLRFFPSTLNVTAGQPITFIANAQEPHTISFGPPAELKEISNALPTPMPFDGPGAPPTLWLDPRGVLPSDRPPLPPYDGANHGDGFYSTGVLGKAIPAGTSTTFSFSKPGTYNYVCLIHPNMKGTVVVS
jgi:plastocyanin